MDMDFEVLHDIIDKDKVLAPADGIHVYGMEEAKTEKKFSELFGS